MTVIARLFDTTQFLQSDHAAGVLAVAALVLLNTGLRHE